MGYGGVISLKQTIQRLLDSSKFTLDSSTREILGFAYKEATSLQQLLGDCDGVGKRRLDRLDGQIRETVHKLEDFLELHQSDLFLDEDNLSIHSERVRQEINWFSERAKKLGEDYGAEADEEEDDAAPASSSNTGFCEEMVGFSDDLRSMERHVTSTLRPDDWGFMVIFGAAGTGRSLVAKKALDDVMSRGELCFDYGVWVSVGPNYERERILQLILSQILMIDNRGVAGSEEQDKSCVWSRLKGRRYMIVLDDVCDTDIFNYLINLFPVQNNGSVVLVTTGAMVVRNHVSSYYVYGMSLNLVDEIWDVLRHALFRVQLVPPELEEAGRKIVWNCRGMPLCISKVLLYLWRAERSPEAWNEIAFDQHHPLFQIADEFLEIRKIEEELAKLTIELDNDKAATALNAYVIKDFGMSAASESIEKKLFPERFFPKMEVISFFGMAGNGKTTFVKKIFEYLRNLHFFNHWVCVWISLGPKYKADDIFIDIMAQIFPDIRKTEMKGDVELADDLSRKLLNKTFLIVLDDVWDEAPLRNLAKLFPNIKGRALVTTRFAEVGKSERIDIIREMRLLSKEESWKLLRQKVFCNGRSCPRELQKAGKKIAKNCDGLPLTVVKVAKLISKDLSPEYWNEVANKNNPDFTNALRELSKTLQPCYGSLPLYLKPCFLYMGVFPESYEISTTKVLQLWTAEGFLEPGLSQRDEDFAAQCLLELVNRSLVMVCHKGTSSYGVETCRLNSVLWHLSNDEAAKNQFFHAYDSVQGMKNQRRFCIRNCILLRIKDIHDSMMDSVATARSLVCTGPYHQYQLPVCFKLRLLRVLDILVIRFYEFPIEVVKLIHLRHLAITCDGNLPTSISGLWNLQFLIVSRHLRIKSFEDSSSYLPMEIWDMKELRHLQVTGGSLPTPSRGTILPNLVTLFDMSPENCIEEVLEAIPNLKRLGFRIELAPGDAKPYDYLNHISNSLSKLESLKCIVVNPEVNPEVGFDVVVVPVHLWMLPAHLSMFSSNLVKLSLSGLGYPWSYMKKFCCWLVNLEVLKLKCYAFQGDKWELCDDAFRKLKHLIIEDTDLVCWKTTSFSLLELRHLSIKHCYNLEELPYGMAGVEMIEVVDCNPFTVNWAEQLIKRNPNPLMPLATERVSRTHVESSWDVVQPQYKRLVILVKNFTLIAAIFLVSLKLGLALIL